MTLVIVLVVLAAIVAWVVGMYNTLVQGRNRVKNAWSQIDVQLQRRFDLLPNLVETVKGYMKHEEDTLTKVTELRTSWANATTVEQKVELDNQLSGALKTIMAVSENYPELKANQNFSELQEELRNTENKISYSKIINIPEPIIFDIISDKWFFNMLPSITDIVVTTIDIINNII